MTTRLTELEENIITINWMIEDYGTLVDTAIEHILPIIEELAPTSPQVALWLSRMYTTTPIWEERKKWALKAYNETNNS